MEILFTLVRAIKKQTKKKLKIQIGKKKVKLSLFVDGMILYIDNSKDSSKKLLELVSEFSKVAGHKINKQISAVFLNL